jgi:hypothetical protein
LQHHGVGQKALKWQWLLLPQLALHGHAYNEIGKSCMTVAVKACAKKKDAKSDMK